MYSWLRRVVRVRVCIVEGEIEASQDKVEKENQKTVVSGPHVSFDLNQ